MAATNDELAAEKLKQTAMRTIKASLSTNVYRGRPAQRLAAQIANSLIGVERHSPDKLQYTLSLVDELQNRLRYAKV